MSKTIFKTIEDFGKSFTKGSFGMYCATFTPKNLNKFPSDKTRKQQPLMASTTSMRGVCSRLAYIKMLVVA